MLTSYMQLFTFISYEHELKYKPVSFFYRRGSITYNPVIFFSLLQSVPSHYTLVISYRRFHHIYPVIYCSQLNHITPVSYYSRFHQIYPSYLLQSVPSHIPLLSTTVGFITYTPLISFSRFHHIYTPVISFRRFHHTYP